MSATSDIPRCHVENFSKMAEQLSSWWPTSWMGQWTCLHPFCGWRFWGYYSKDQSTCTNPQMQWQPTVVCIEDSMPRKADKPLWFAPRFTTSKQSVRWSEWWQTQMTPMERVSECGCRPTSPNPRTATMVVVVVWKEKEIEIDIEGRNFDRANTIAKRSLPQFFLHCCWGKQSLPQLFRKAIFASEPDYRHPKKL